MGTEETTSRTTCCVVGGGPAGMILGLLLARAGVEVTVLEKHADFLRDFRGDTVHTSTLTLLDELGLWPRFAQLPYRELTKARIRLDSGDVDFADMTRLNEPHPMVAMVPQWHLLDMLAAAAREEPTFTLRMSTEVTGMVRSGDRVTGVRLADRAEDGTLGPESELAADLVVACDGRDSRLRADSACRCTAITSRSTSSGSGSRGRTTTPRAGSVGSAAGGSWCSSTAATTTSAR